jgi:hypothetical protein
MNKTISNETDYELINNTTDLLTPDLIFNLIIFSNLIAILWNNYLDIKNVSSSLNISFNCNNFNNLFP